MNELLRRYDFLYTIVFFALMLVAEPFESFNVLEDETLAYRHILRWSMADSDETSFRDDAVFLVNTDEEFYEEYGGFPLRRADYGILAQNLKKLGAEVIAIDALMDYRNSYGEDPRTAELFADAGDVLLVSAAEIDTDNKTVLGMNYPIPAFREVARSGYSNISSQSALRERMTRLRLFPEAIKRPEGWPFAVQALAMYLDGEPRLEGDRLLIGDEIDVPLVGGMDFYIDFPRLPGGTQYVSETFGMSAMDILNLDTLHPDDVADLRLEVEGKIILIGDTSEVAHDIFETPVGSVYGVEIIADSISTLLRGVPIRPMPYLGEILITLVFLALVLGTALVSNPATRILMQLGVVTAFIGLAVVLYGSMGLALSMSYTLLGLVFGVLLINARYYLLSDETAAAAGRESAESNRMLALAFQGQGQLDMAFDKIKKVPLDNSIADLVYNIALDFERRRQFSKAIQVYKYLENWNAEYRDIDQRIKKAEAIEANPLANNASAGATLISSVDGMEKPMLGRYEVTEELGQGAMGIVYKGVDPKIDRTVAIKTMALSSEFEDDALNEAKERFFREAQSAGRLNHPNIVAVYDAGEEHDLAYIAMEFLHGKDLSAWSKPDTLLPLETVIDVVIQCAEALDYAHKAGVVHRDVKPSNMMFDETKGQAKLTDFGIARITDSSKTRTGTVLGTPNYMSPEQALGDKVDGRSDLFSLGIVLYQLSSGRLPFQGDSMASLMYKIVNEAHPDIKSINPNIPGSVRKVIDNALRKKPERRYQSGEKMAEHLRLCKQRLQSASAGAAASE